MDLQKQITSLNNSYQAEDVPGVKSEFLCYNKINLNSAWVKPEFYSGGNGVKLKNIPLILHTVESASDPFIKVLHHLLFLSSDEGFQKMFMHRNILEFSGLSSKCGNMSFQKRMEILSLLSDQQLELISRSLCISVPEHSRQTLSQAIINFISFPQVISEKNRVLPISRDEFDLYFNDLDVIQMISKIKDPDFAEIDVSPTIHHANETVTISSTEGMQLHGCELVKGEVQKVQVKQETEILNVSSTKDAINSQLQFMEGQEQTFTKMINLPNPLEACQNYDLNNQKEIFHSGMTLPLNPGSYTEQGIIDEEAEFRLACANYMKNYHATQQLSKKKSSSLSRETEEQAAARRAQNALRMRIYRQNLRAHETEEQAALRRAQNALRVRNYRKFKTQPELAKQYRSQNSLRMKMYRENLRARETEEEAAARRAANVKRVQLYRKIKKGLIPNVTINTRVKQFIEYRPGSVANK